MKDGQGVIQVGNKSASPSPATASWPAKPKSGRSCTHGRTLPPWNLFKQSCLKSTEKKVFGDLFHSRCARAVRVLCANGTMRMMSVPVIFVHSLSFVCVHSVKFFRTAECALVTAIRFRSWYW